MGLTQTFFKLLPLCWVLECVSLCVCPWRVESVFFQLSDSLVYKFHRSLKPDVHLLDGESWVEDSSSWYGTAGLETLMWDLNLLLLEENLCNCDYLLFVGYLSGVCVLHIPCVYFFYPSHCGSFFIPLVMENIFCWSSGSSHRNLLCK